MSSARLEENKEFLELLHSRRGCDLFRKFVKRIACDENLIFWVEVELLKNSIPTPTSTCKTETETETTKQRNEALWKKFFKVGGNYELNVDSDSVEKVKERLFGEDEKEANNPHIYDGVQEDVYILMLNDSFGKFKKTPEYVKYLKMRQDGTVNNPIEREKERKEKDRVEKEEEETPKQFVNKSRSYIKHTKDTSSSSLSSSSSSSSLSRRHSFTTGLFGSKKNNKLASSSSSRTNLSLDVPPHVEEKHTVRIAETKGKEAMDGASSPPSTSPRSTSTSPRSHHSPRFQLPSNSSTSATSLSTATTTSNNIDARFASTEGKEELLTIDLIPTSTTSPSSTSPRGFPSTAASTSDPTGGGVVKKPSSSIFKEQQLLDLLEPMNPADTPVSIQEQLARRKSWSGRPSDSLYSSAAKRSEKRNEENSHRKPMRSRLGSSLRNIFGGGSSITGRDGGSHRIHSTVSASLSEDDDPSVKRRSMSHLFTFQRKKTTRNPTSPLSSSPPSSPPSISPTTSAVGLRNLTGSGGQIEDKDASTFSFGTVSHATFAITPSSSSSSSLVRSPSDLLFEAFYNSNAGETKASSSTSAGC